MKVLKSLMVTAAVAVALMANAAHAENKKIALVVKALGIGFFEAANKGAQEAAKELGDVEIIYTGPTSTTAEGQIEVINSLIAQKVDAIAVSANDTDALVPALKKAMDRGIKVISWDSGVAKGRPLDASQSVIEPADRQHDHQARRRQSARRRRCRSALGLRNGDQSEYVDRRNEEGPGNYKGINVVATVYGDDLTDKSHRETQGLIQSHPNLKAIIAPTSVGIVAAAQAVTDAGKIGQINVTGLGLPPKWPDT